MSIASQIYAAEFVNLPALNVYAKELIANGIWHLWRCEDYQDTMYYEEIFILLTGPNSGFILTEDGKFKRVYNPQKDIKYTRVGVE